MATIQQCSMCPYFTSSTDSILQHIVCKHTNAQKFIAHCNAKGCGASFQNYNSFKVHIKPNHKDDVHVQTAHEAGHSMEDDTFYVRILTEKGTVD